jgi:hypothetical protein
VGGTSWVRGRKRQEAHNWGGIMPNYLFLVGSYNYLEVTGAGTLYLGINDWKVEDNSGSLTVTASWLAK